MGTSKPLNTFSVTSKGLQTGDFDTPSQIQLLQNTIQLNVYKVTLPGQLTRFPVSTPTTASTHSQIVTGALKMPLIPKKVNSGVPMKSTHCEGRLSHTWGVLLIGLASVRNVAAVVFVNPRSKLWMKVSR
jgi:hypothetical protein